MEQSIPLTERLDHLRRLIQDEDFLTGKGLSNEVNIRFFCYDPAEELTVRAFLRQIETHPPLACRPKVVHLYQLFLDLCREADILEAAEEMEAADGSAYLLEQLQFAIGCDTAAGHMAYAPHERGDVLVLCEVGEVYPFLRVHQLLESLQPLFSDMPILVMYPGTFDGRQLRLFGKMTPSDYYRAFAIV